MIGCRALPSGRTLSRTRLSDGAAPARIAVLPLGGQRWVSACALADAPWGDVPGQHPSVEAAVAAAVREIERLAALRRRS
jgi:hypothetical protein